MKYKLEPLGDRGIMIDLGNEIDSAVHDKIQNITRILDNYSESWITEYIPAFTTVAVFYNPMFFYTSSVRVTPYEAACMRIHELLKKSELSNRSQARKVEIPVCYGGSFGPDLQFVADHNSLTLDEVIRVHTSGDYLVYMIGFAPGFPYIGGMPAEIAAPRKESPRLKIPPGSVGIAGEQTGVYPIETPGGWQIIGRTPLPLFQPEQMPPSLLQAGDHITFTAIDEDEYQRLQEEHHDHD
ncbi:5-oxoprolinase subunit PxpB [Peribacillus kribbensis]|uniref:5-oxoprolinase subunit PxpB n=1 Tax=Peribacillus kribbensis TaxID=356658 RepID=UPI00041B4F6B